MNHILVVEDDPSISMVISEVLQDLDCTVEVVPNGKEALDKVCAERPAAIVLNLRLPIMDGETFLKAWRRMDATCEDVPIVLTSAAREGPEVADRLGVHAFLPKPFNIDDLLQLVEGAANAASE